MQPCKVANCHKRYCLSNTFTAGASILDLLQDKADNHMQDKDLTTVPNGSSSICSSTDHHTDNAPENFRLVFYCTICNTIIVDIT